MKPETIANLSAGITDIMTLLDRIRLPAPLSTSDKLEFSKVLLSEWLQRTGSDIFRREV